MSVAIEAGKVLGTGDAPLRPGRKQYILEGKGPGQAGKPHGVHRVAGLAPASC